LQEFQGTRRHPGSIVARTLAVINYDLPGMKRSGLAVFARLGRPSW
jgi:hypothetical protein